VTVPTVIVNLSVSGNPPIGTNDPTVAKRQSSIPFNFVLDLIFSWRGGSLSCDRIAVGRIRQPDHFVGLVDNADCASQIA
jgi:hypothetical protein